MAVLFSQVTFLYFMNKHNITVIDDITVLSHFKELKLNSYLETRNKIIKITCITFFEK